MTKRRGGAQDVCHPQTSETPGEERWDSDRSPRTTETWQFFKLTPPLGGVCEFLCMGRGGGECNVPLVSALHPCHDE